MLHFSPIFILPSAWLPQSFISSFSLLSTPNFSTQSITYIISFCKDRGSSIRTHIPLCHTSFKYLYHFPIGRNSNWWYFHLSSLSMLHLEKRWWFQIAHYLFPTQAQDRFQYCLYRDPDLPQSHNVLWAVLQSRRCIIMSSESWLCGLSWNGQLWGRVICNTWQSVCNPP